MSRSIRLAVLSACLLCGCGGKPPGPEKFTVTGAVTLDGQPVADGNISFDSADGKSGAGAIKNGRYTAEVPAGKKTVRIHAPKATGQKGQYGEDVVEELIPRQYNADSKESIEVKSAGENKFDFKLVSAKK